MDDTLQLMHNLAVQGMAEPDDLFNRVPVEEHVARSTLDSLIDEGLVDEEGFVYLTDDGEERLDDLCRERFTENERDRLEDLFESFEELDEELKELAVRWQDTDHSDREVVNERLAELSAFHDRIRSEVEALEGDLRNEYEWYQDRLSSALAKAREGQFEYITGSDVASYHNIWFAFHEDLLRTLGRERT